MTSSFRRCFSLKPRSGPATTAAVKQPRTTNRLADFPTSSWTLSSRRFHVYGHCPFISCTAVSAATLAHCGPVSLIFFLAICGVSSNGLPVVVSIVVSTFSPTCSAKRKTLAAIFCTAEEKAARVNVVEEKPAGIPDECQFDIGHKGRGI